MFQPVNDICVKCKVAMLFQTSFKEKSDPLGLRGAVCLDSCIQKQ